MCVVIFTLAGKLNQPVMENETKYKFEPIFTTVLSLLTFYAIYKSCSLFIAKPSYDLLGLSIFISSYVSIPNISSYVF